MGKRKNPEMTVTIINDQKLISVLDKIIILESSINKIYTLADNYFDKINTSSKRSGFFKKAAEISELSGYLEKAYSANPVEENTNLLTNAAVLTLETGDFEKAQYLADMSNKSSR